MKRRLRPGFTTKGTKEEIIEHGGTEFTRKHFTFGLRNADFCNPAVGDRRGNIQIRFHHEGHVETIVERSAMRLLEAGIGGGAFNRKDPTNIQIPID